MCDGIAVWAREMRRPESERSPTTLAHEAARTQRIDFARTRGLGDLTASRPQLAAWLVRINDLPSMRATAFA
jgi:hypothetical protein